MKKPIILILFIFSFFSGFSQGEQQAPATDSIFNVKLWTKYPGYVITRNNDTIRGYLMLKNLVNNQDKVLFYNNRNDEKYTRKYKPKDLKAYKTGPRFYESFKFKPPSTYSANDARTWHFLLKVIDGPFKVYKWFYETKERSESRVKVDEEHPLNTKVDLSFSEKDLEYHTYGLTPSGEFVDFNSMKMLTNFKKNMSKLVADNPQLAAKIKNKEKGYHYYDVEKIIREYNKWYIQNHPGK